MSESFIRALPGNEGIGFLLTVHAKPGARISRVCDFRSPEALEVQIAARPVEGAANAELVSFLATVFRVKPRNVALVSGDKSRLKTLRITGCPIDQAAGFVREAACEE